MVKYLKMLIRYYDPAMEAVAAELINTLSDKEKVEEAYWFVFSNPKLTPEGSANEAWLLKITSVSIKRSVRKGGTGIG